MRYINKIQSYHDEIGHTMKVLYSILGNKRYLKDLEDILSRVELRPEERQTFHLLARDLQSLENKKDESWRKF